MLALLIPTSTCLHHSYPQECSGLSSLTMSTSFKVTPTSSTVSVFLLNILTQEYVEDFQYWKYIKSYIAQYVFVYVSLI